MEVAAGVLGAAAAIGSKFTSPSNFTARHEFEGLPGEHVPIEDAFTFEDLRAKAAASRDTYSENIREYKEIPLYKIRQKRRMRKYTRSAKRATHSANTDLRSFVESAANRSRSGSIASDVASCDSVSIMAESGSPPNASLEALETSQRVSEWVDSFWPVKLQETIPEGPPISLWKPDSMACNFEGVDASPFWYGATYPDEEDYFRAFQESLDIG
ncbi:hypothetical protein DL96DRAFT_1814290 [Flagelloscypha sp. PMI_526]|nr:hypothetical protein DL96DRAFT_1814290 [Flagelloscypha sp. PMI_526]